MISKPFGMITLGKGVTLGIIDDGIDYNHIDLVDNYNLLIDYDALGDVLVEGSDDPRSDGLDDFHGTAVAGLMAGSLGGGEMVGVAYEASLAMFRMGFGFEASASQTESALTQMQNALTWLITVGLMARLLPTTRMSLSPRSFLRLLRLPSMWVGRD